MLGWRWSARPHGPHGLNQRWVHAATLLVPLHGIIDHMNIQTYQSMKNNRGYQDTMDPDMTRNIAYIVGALALVLSGRFIQKRMVANRARMLAASEPKIAGEDVMEGGARNPQQFEEPDDEALEEMAKLLGEDEDSGDES